MSQSYEKPDKLIINSPYEMPKKFWLYDGSKKTFQRESGRRVAGFLVATPNARAWNDPGRFVPIPNVGDIRERVDKWREKGYTGISGVTKKLLEHWQDEEREKKFFFCQIEAIETLIWFIEAPEAQKQGIDIPSDGGEFERLCSKMATGTGKTVVMAMLVAWQVLNKVDNPKDTRFSKNVFVVAPGLTVKNRLQVLKPTAEENYYDEFEVVPFVFREKLNQGKVHIQNWHTLAWDDEEKIAKKKSVDKRGVKSNEAYTREVLGDMQNAKNFIVINDEAHHAWRVPPEFINKKDEDTKEATIWIGGLDRLHKSRRILKCFDFSATPFMPSGNKNAENYLFSWIISDFGLNDAIESGLVKTPRNAVRDDLIPDAKTYKSRFYHIYMNQEVKDDLTRKAEPQEPLPSLVSMAYYLLGADWRETKRAWKEAGHTIPPAMITVANRTETAARIEYSFLKNKIDILDLCEEERLLRIDSKILKQAEEVNEPLAEIDNNGEEAKSKLTRKEEAELLREKVCTVGRVGKKGEKIQNIISVAMLSEGWDAKNVTHIMGLRAFSSQLLCEQVVGRGLRRTSYDVDDKTGLFEAEYVNIFGVPFSFLPHEDTGGTPQPTPPKTEIKPLTERQNDYEINWPNIIRIDYAYKYRLKLDLSRITILKLDAAKVPLLVELAPVVDGQNDLGQIKDIDLIKLDKKERMQSIIFKTAGGLFEGMQKNWQGDRNAQMAQLVKIVEMFIEKGKISITPPLFNQNGLRKRIIIKLNMSHVINHIKNEIEQENVEELVPIFDTHKTIRSTVDMQSWYTSKPCDPTKKSHINYCIHDGTWESAESFHLDRSNKVKTWVKNDHLGFEILYVTGGVVRKYRPDYIVKLKNGKNLILEVKGLEKDTQKTKDKKNATEIWVNAINQHGGFGEWYYRMSKAPREAETIIEKLSTSRS